LLSARQPVLKAVGEQQVFSQFWLMKSFSPAVPVVQNALNLAQSASLSTLPEQESVAAVEAAAGAGAGAALGVAAGTQQVFWQL
jgi:hypothetical protein